MRSVSALRALASGALYPLTLGASLAAAWRLLQRGVAPAAVVLLLFVAAAALVAVLERALPYAPEWRRPAEDRRTDALHLITSVLLSSALLRLLALACVTSHAGPRAGAWWPQRWPLGLQLLLALSIAELGAYWSHRLLHLWPRLWAFHTVHHSAARLYWLNASRNHPVDTALSLVATTLPLLALQISDQLFCLYSVFTSTHLLLQHSNVDLRSGPLSYLLSTAEVHRWHHARRPEESDGNYGHVLLLWDLLLGTRSLPARRPPVHIGFEGDRGYPTGFLAQLRWPFDGGAR